MSTKSDFDFAEFITDLDHGQVNARLGKEMREINEAVEETGLVGTLTITIKVKRDASHAFVRCESKAKIPKLPNNAALFYFGEGGALHREDPKQLKLKHLDEPAAPLRVLKDEKKN